MRTLYKIIIVLAILFVSFEIEIAIPGRGSFIYALITLIIIAGIINYTISIYNDLVTERNRVKNSWSKIDVQLKRRTDLIPNLVEVVKGYAKHEHNTFTQVSQARASLMNARNIEDIQKSNSLSIFLFRVRWLLQVQNQWLPYYKVRRAVLRD